MKQLITRMDESLHSQLKRRAALEHRSVNAVVIDALTSYVAANDRVELSTVLREEGLLEQAAKAPKKARDREAVLDLTKGWGTAVSEALENERNSRW